MIQDANFTLGYMKLTDAAPYIIAKEMGFFEKYQLNVTLAAQNSWATVRDKLEAGLLDAAQMLAPMPLASALGISGSRRDIMTPLITSQNGNAITIANSLYNELCDIHGLSDLPIPMPSSLFNEAIKHRCNSQREPIKLGSVFPFSCHYLQLLDYLHTGNVDIGDVELLFIPPSRMADSLAHAQIDGFCVGGPYNAASVRNNLGITVATSHDIWQDKAEKVLGVSEQAYVQRPHQYHLLCAALLDACEWLTHVPNRFEAARILASPQYLDESLDCIAPSLIGSCLTIHNKTPRHIPHYNRFSAIDPSNDCINRPCQHQGEWLLDKLQKAWPHLIADHPPIKLNRCFRSDVFDLSVACRIT